MQSRLSLLVGIAAIIFAACAALLYFEYSDATAYAQELASRIFAESAMKADEEIDALLDRAIGIAVIGPTVVGIGDPVRSDGMDLPALKFLVGAVNSAPSIYAVYYGLSDGSFLEAIGAHMDPDIVKAMGAPAGTDIVVRTVVPSGPARMQYWTFLDATGAALGRRTDPTTSYDPRTTDWYRRASGETGPVLTEPYRFSSIPVLGVTVVRNLPGNTGVFGVDFTLSELSRIVAAKPVSPNGVLYIFDESMDLVAAPPSGPNGVPTAKLMSDMRKLGVPVLQTLAELSHDGPVNRTVAVRVQSADYVALVSEWRGRAAPKIDLGIAAPLSDFTGRMEPVLIRTFVAAAAILLSAIALVTWFGRQSARIRRQGLIIERRAEELRRENVLVSEILVSAPVAITMTSDNVVRYANPQAETLLGVKAGEKIDCYVDAAERARLLAQVERDGIVRDAAIKMYGAGRTIHDVRVTLTPIDCPAGKGILAWIVEPGEITG